MFIRKKGCRQFLALFFLSTLLFQIGFPTVAYALTSGPTAPEATSFEPVDTTEMVNPQTGDFTYNIPLLEVPGPEGGYPLALSYHAGIQPGEDASWTGLGWSLNPGAITRNVNGYPDDWYSETALRRDFWEGGQTTSYNIGVSVGIASTPATVSFGLSFSQDTYRGFGVGMDVGAGIKYGNVSVGVSAGISPYGDEYAGLGINLSQNPDGPGLGASLNVGISGNGTSISGSAGYDVKGNTVLGVSMGSNNPQGSLTLGGYTANTRNNQAGNIQTDESGFSLDIPITYLVNVRLGYNYTRYWSDESVNVPVHGSLNLPGWDMITQSHAFDTYSLLNYDPAYMDSTNIVDNNDADLLQGGTYPDFDNYHVTAQGMAGTMRPYIFQGYVARQNRSNQNSINLTYVCPGQGNSTTMMGVRPQFRFDNDFSNQYRQQFNDFDLENVWGNKLPAPFDPAPVYGNGDGMTAYNPATTELAGSRSIRTIDYATLFSAADKKGFLYPSGTTGFSYDAALNKSIGGYAITNSSGVTYHYSLPAYSFNESIYSEKIDAGKGNGMSKNFNRQVKPGKYAYTWYLTGVTGPDYVDRNGNGVLDEGDWGYWVKFEYGKWTDSYYWRNPEAGFTPDIDNKFQNASKGQKEIYYLNTIKTRSHTALFVKDIRNDGRGAAAGIMSTSGDTENSGYYDNTSAYTLKLDRILLYANADMPAVNMTSTSPLNINQHYASNVLDKYDVSNADFEKNAFRIIDLKYDYSLCKSTLNSFTTNPASTGGKLTLTQMLVKGRGGACMLPATDFIYEPENVKAGMIVSMAAPDPGSGIGQITTGTIPNGGYQIGDILTINQNLYCGVIIKKYSAVNFDIKYFPGYAPSSSGATQMPCQLTKNPPYQQKARDMWGMFKSDYNPALAAKNANLGGVTNVISAASVDAWSLRAVNTALGSKIKVEYESDVYSKAVLNRVGSYVINNFIFDNNTRRLKFTVSNADKNVPLSSIYKVGSKVDAIIAQELIYWLLGTYPTPQPLILRTQDTRITDPTDFTITAIDDSNMTITVSCHSINLMDITDPKVEVHNILTGNLFYTNNINQFGGGLRVKSLSVTTSQNTVVNDYDYRIPDQADLSSGVTSFEPSVFDYDEVSSYAILAPVAGRYKKELYKGINYLLTIAREVPAPGVIYKNIAVSKKVIAPDGSEHQVDGRTAYEFEVFNENMITRRKVGKGTTVGYYHGTPSDMVNIGNNQSIQNLSSAVGTLRSIINYDNQGNKLSATYNNYLHDDFNNSSSYFLTDYFDRGLSRYNYQGVIIERDVEEKYVNNLSTGKSKIMLTMSAKEQYPVIKTGEDKIDYKTGITTKTRNIGFDFYSGEVTKTKTQDTYGNSFMTEIIPAYRVYPQMGLKINNTTNKNMLSQVAASYTYKLDANDTKTGVINAQAQVWSNNLQVRNPDNSNSIITQQTTALGNVWRKQASYIWQPAGNTTDGIMPLAQFIDFNWANPQSSNIAWRKAEELTLYSVNSHPLESKDINGNYSAVKYGYQDSRLVITGKAAQYNEIAYSSAEDDLIGSTFETGVGLGNGVIERSTSFPAATAHTGYSSLKTSAGKEGFGFTVVVNNEQLNRQYRGSVWVKSSSGAAPSASLYYQVNNGTQVPATVIATRKAGEWYQLNIVTPASAAATTGNSIKFGCINNGSTDVFFDDFLIQPLNASATAYVYDKTSGEVAYILDGNNMYKRYEFDAAGKLTGTYTETFSNGVIKTSEFEYNYGKGCIASTAGKALPRISFYKKNLGLI
ncbi:hypothetical protein [Chitinophaga flava]|uniref:CBM6 domain-containing protein n=1 Tax=Chitinophaga flava TaxID=2259036 RepID=A0A365Y360_9BACT|nr:hypothetical protein [Chitinophaga flava]RBL92758.1 hypothetical protein DF182_09325 [Chitinophaga flava]